MGALGNSGEGLRTAPSWVGIIGAMAPVLIVLLMGLIMMVRYMERIDQHVVKDWHDGTPPYTQALVDRELATLRQAIGRIEANSKRFEAALHRIELLLAEGGMAGSASP